MKACLCRRRDSGLLLRMCVCGCHCATVVMVCSWQHINAMLLPLVSWLAKAACHLLVQFQAPYIHTTCCLQYAGTDLIPKIKLLDTSTKQGKLCHRKRTMPRAVTTKLLRLVLN